LKLNTRVEERRRIKFTFDFFYKVYIYKLNIKY